jgi:uncharacterized membrane protein YeaQ/YmgE (transglycosylase-associated protein family)
MALGLIIGLVGIAVGAHVSDPAQPWVDLKKLSILTLIFSVVGAFLAFAAGGWIAGKVAGFRRSEPAMLHGAIVWLVAVPLLLLLISLGAGSFFGGWYGGLAGTPTWVTPAATPQLTPADRENREKIARNTALGSVTALLLGLVGGVIGGWMASGEPMTFSHYRSRRAGAAYQAGEAPVSEEVPVRR